MAPVQRSPDLPSVEHHVTLETSSPGHQGLTPPDSPTKGTATSQAVLKDLQYPFGMFLGKTLLELTSREPPNTPVSQDQSLSSPDMARLKKLLMKLTRDECASAELSVATKPAQSCPASNKKEDGAQVADGIDLGSPIFTTPDDFKSFEKWASIAQFKPVMEIGDKEVCKYKIAEQVETHSGLDDYAGYTFIVRERFDRNFEEVTPYIGIKSEGMRHILRIVLHDIKAISLMEDKPSAIKTK
ncbi:hypothetical protein POX_a00884 [Penicillium oxalicum]|uniref:Uncharacterized protein n=1 Tax=Penicillium oxalicum (strain 114-2 / CGMCC 5302) TaxID=933388 RepID=S8B5J7_PENO1|nr:hypothetical protein POX_a00884 [Penicillium oxalicum]EPS34138.1 hypothetical protein PDE_09100 [Penicillium oxalicum 114-2]KAI2794291.1 hypothetical protein POX_a00884 [Penicillium oxalicum]